MKFIDFYQLQQRIDLRKLNRLLILILLVLMSYSILNLGLGLYSVMSQTKTTKVTSIKTLPTIANFHLFGVAGGDELPIAVLNTQLQGIFYSTDPKHARIVAAAAGGAAQVYQVNDVLPEGVTIKSIKPDEVIIDQDGQLQRWLLPVPRLQFAPPADGLQQLGVGQ